MIIISYTEMIPVIVGFFYFYVCRLYIDIHCILPYLETQIKYIAKMDKQQFHNLISMSNAYFHWIFSKK